MNILQGLGSVFPTEPVLAFRASAVPYCAAFNLWNVLHPGVTDFGAEFYFAVGTAVHSVVQRFLATDPRFVGLWECQCGARWGEVQSCPTCKCGAVPSYVEVSGHYLNMTAHVDGLLLCSKDGLPSKDGLLGKSAGCGKTKDVTVLEFKTCSAHKTASGRGLPYAKHLWQTHCYLLVLRELGITASDYAVVYFSRDRPPKISRSDSDWGRSTVYDQNVRQFRQPFNLKVVKHLQAADVGYRACVQFVTRPCKETLLAVRRTRLCALRPYQEIADTFYRPCPFFDTCHQEQGRQLVQQIWNRRDQCPSVKYVPVVD